MSLFKIEDILKRLDGYLASWKSMGDIPAIERDLALEELRRLYEELLQCSGDTTLASSVGEVLSALPAREAVEEFDDILDIDALLGLDDKESTSEPLPAPEQFSEPEPIIEPVEEFMPELDSTPRPESELESKPKSEPEPVKQQPFGGGLFDIEDIPIRTKRGRKMISLYNSPVEQPVQESRVERIGVSEPEPMPTPASTPKFEPASKPAPAPISEPKVVSPIVAGGGEQPMRLGDVLGGGVTVLADKMAVDDTSTPVFNKIDDLSQAIGLNDKFLMIRDLFDGDASKFEDTIETLNEFDDLDECMIYIVENFAWNPDSEGARLLVSLIERKLA